MKEMKFCSSCQAHRKIEGGKMRDGRWRTRWVCQQCDIEAKRRQPPLIAAFAPKKPDPLWRNL